MYIATTRLDWPLIRTAVLSRDGRYRYALRRVWDVSRPTVLFVGFNPSTADAICDDPTIRRCIGFAKRWNFGQLVVGNLFAFRTPWPHALRCARNPIGRENDRWLRRLACEADLVIAAWGGAGSYRARDRQVHGLLGPMKCLGLTRTGQPRHPLYVRGDVELLDLAILQTA